MYKYIKYLKYVQIGIFALSALVILLFYIQNGTGNFALENLGWAMDHTSMIDGLLWWTYALLAITLLLVIVLNIHGMTENPASLKKMGFTLLLVVGLILISFLFASGDPVVVNIEEQPSAVTLKMTDTGLMLTYILLAAAILAIVGGSIMRIIKNR